MNAPILDPRGLEEIMAQVATHARQYTPEWRYEGTADDPGAAIARLFGEMFYQTVDRFNAVPEKLYLEFLELVGVLEPDPVPSSGLLQFNAHDTVEKAVPVPAGTQVFTADEAGENIIYETERRIESTSARLEHLFYSDPRGGVIQELKWKCPQRFFTSVDGENLQCHRFSVSQNEVLNLSGPCTVEVEVRGESSFAAAETAKALADPEKMRWSYRCGGSEQVFDNVRMEGACLILEKTATGALEADDEGNRFLTCTCAGALAGNVLLDGIRLRSTPAGLLPVEQMASGDTPILPEEGGGYCFGRRPTPYSLFYLRFDRAFCKCGARVNLRLTITPIVTDYAQNSPQYQFNQRIIDKQDAVTVKPDDVFVDEVAWEYFNGTGWTRLPVSGSRNPFSCKETDAAETLFTVPEDICPVEVNAEEGFFIRARVVHVENEFSLTPRWIVPFIQLAECFWQYPAGRPADRYRSENNGDTVWMRDAADVSTLRFPALTSLPEEPAAVYLCFDRSPNAMPLSLLFEISGRAALSDKLAFEAWTGKRFEKVRSVDFTRNLLHTGLALLYLPTLLPQARFFGCDGYWLRIIRSSYLENSGGYPLVSGVRLNTVLAVQRRKTEEQWFDTDTYEAGKILTLLETPALGCQVWVDEVNGLTVAEAEALKKECPERIRLEREDGLMTHCWVLWERLSHLELADGGRRGYLMDPYAGTVTFGDGLHGRVPPKGEANIRVTYANGGGKRGNRPEGAVTELIGALPFISSVANLTPMSGGTDRFSPEKKKELGNKRLRHRYRALGIRDFEEMVLEQFPQAQHVRCFAGRDEKNRKAPGNVTVVVENPEADTGRAALDLCDRIQEYLEARCSCTLKFSGGLHVIPSAVLTVNTQITVEVENPDEAAATQRNLVDRLTELIDRRWRSRGIGDQLRIGQLWQTVRDTPNVRLTRKILVEGVYDEDGATRCVPLEHDKTIPYATVRSGEHLIRVC